MIRDWSDSGIPLSLYITLAELRLDDSTVGLESESPTDSWKAAQVLSLAD